MFPLTLKKNTVIMLCKETYPSICDPTSFINVEVLPENYEALLKCIIIAFRWLLYFDMWFANK